MVSVIMGQFQPRRDLVIKALIFDFDGLIMDTESPEVDGWKAIYADYGQEFPLQTWSGNSCPYSA
jgi:beta-phosphoglucomutase-like phosphatase (HAD superfamily)